jgi:ATP-binding cassette subfamily B (MDR/TAP) protein 1
LTSSGFEESHDYSQAEIDEKVKKEAKKLNDSFNSDNINSLYPTNSKAFSLAHPTIVLTQDLCSVCAPSPKDVYRMLQEVGRSGDDDEECKVYSMNPHSLTDVAETFSEVGILCGVPEKGLALRNEFLAKLDMLQQIVSGKTESFQEKKKVLLLEWIDPPYDGGHWIPDMIEKVGCQVAKVGKTDGIKSKRIQWDDVYESDPDIILVACCGFDMERNKKDAISASSKLRSMRAARNGDIYACNGDLNFARPGPLLLDGATVIARCAFDGDESVVRALEGLDFVKNASLEWEKVHLDLSKRNDAVSGASSGLPCDIEDLGGNLDFDAIHKAACDQGAMSYKDPDTGYQVFTELAHKKRGKCCGSGCRHCPYSHVNVKDKASKIKQPAFLYEGEEALETALERTKNIKVLFWSGGKDSFLALRQMFRNYDSDFFPILLTTFDSISRVIAHQEVHIDQVIRQAKHLDIPLIGVPVHRRSSETYVEKIKRALNCITAKCDTDNITSLCFGDLHLEHIRSWRESEISKLGYELEYPVWEVPYINLMRDLEQSGVEVIIAATTKQGVQVGEKFDSHLHHRVEGLDMDGFGENGEFHSIAKVWTKSRSVALGLDG